jgi:type I restriction enzyme S subunit
MGARRERLQPPDFLDLEIELPSLEEQQQIVAMVRTARADQEALEAAATAREDLYRVLVEELLEGVERPLAEVVDRIESGFSPKCLPRRPRGDEWGVLSTASVRHGAFRSSEAKALPDDVAPKDSARIRPGDLLTIRASGTRRLVGALCVAPEGVGRVLMSDYHWRLILSDRADPRYLMHATAANEVRSQIDEAVIGSTTAGKVSRDRYLAVEVPMPDLAQQQQIAAKLDAVLAGRHAYERAAGRAATLVRVLAEEFVTGARPVPTASVRA